MRVLQITRDYASNGGIGRYVQDLTAALIESGHEVAIVCSEGSKDGPGRIDLIPACDEFEHRDARTNRAAVAAVASAFSPDAVLLHAMDDYQLEVTLRQQYHVARFVHNHVYCPSGLDHDTSSFTPCERTQGRACIRGYMSHRCWRIRKPATAATFYRRAAAAVASLRTAPLLFAGSRYVRGRLVKHGVNARRIILAPYFAAVPETARFSPQPDAGTLLYVGRIVPEKGLGHLLGAMQQVSADARLIVNGDGPARHDMEALAQRLGLRDRVEFIGWTPREELLACYREAAVVVMPSVWPEPFGLAGIEAMAYGKPVVAFRAGATPEWLAHGETGFLVERGDIDGLAWRIRELLADPALRLRMGRAAKVRVSHEFSREQHLAAICDGLSLDMPAVQACETRAHA